MFLLVMHFDGVGIFFSQAKEDSVGLYTPDRPYTIYVGTKSAKRLWLQHIRNAIIAHISEDNPNENVTLCEW